MEASRIGPFSLEEKLGGKHSSVHRAIHLEQRKQVVLKVFTVPFGATEHAGGDFVAEMNLLTQETATSSADSTKTSEELSRQADRLERLVAGFTLPRQGRLTIDEARLTRDEKTGQTLTGDPPRGSSRLSSIVNRQFVNRQSSRNGHHPRPAVE